MRQLDLWGVIVALVTVAGPPKVILSFARLHEAYPPRELRRLAMRATAAAALCGATVALITDPLLAVFHIGHPAVTVAGGVILFVYALRLVLTGMPEIAAGGDGFAALLLPYVASPLGLSSIIVLSAVKIDWRWSGLIALIYVGVTVINLVSMLGLTYVLHRLPRTSVEVASRVLGLLLAAIGVELIVEGVSAVGLLGAPR